MFLFLFYLAKFARVQPRVSILGTMLVGQDMYLHQLAPCTEERLTMCDHMEQSPLCYAALEYIHSLSGAREKKRGKRREKEGGEPRSPEGGEPRSPARDLLRMELDREWGIASTNAVQARLEASERDSKYTAMYMTPNTIA